MTRLVSQSASIWINALQNSPSSLRYFYQVSGVLRRSDSKLLENRKAERSQR